MAFVRSCVVILTFVLCMATSVEARETTPFRAGSYIARKPLFCIEHKRDRYLPVIRLRDRGAITVVSLVQYLRSRRFSRSKRHELQRTAFDLCEQAGSRKRGTPTPTPTRTFTPTSSPTLPPAAPTYISTPHITPTISGGDNDDFPTPASSPNVQPTSPFTPTFTPTSTFTSTPVVTPTPGGPVLTPIARWNVVPYQRLSAGQQINVGVVALSRNGIDRVEFTISGAGYSGGNPKVVHTPSLNPETTTIEYWFTLAATDFTSDGNVSIQARAFGRDGGYRGPETNPGEHNGLDPLALRVNRFGTIPQAASWVNPATGSDVTGLVNRRDRPFRTLRTAFNAVVAAQGGVADGGTLNLEAGDYADITPYGQIDFSNPQIDWFTIQAADGVPSSAVVLRRSATTYNIKKLHVKGVTLDTLNLVKVDDPNVYYEALFMASSTHNRDVRLWIDSCVVQGAGPFNGTGAHPVHYMGGQYWTDTYIHSIRDALRNYNVWYARGIAIDNIGDNALMNVPMAVNISVHGMSPFYGIEVTGASYFPTRVINGSTYQHVVEKANGFSTYTLNTKNNQGDLFKWNEADGPKVLQKISNSAVRLESAIGDGSERIGTVNGKLWTGWHADAWQWVYSGTEPNGVQENAILMNFEVLDSEYQCLSDNSWHPAPVPARNIAFVNVHCGQNLNSYHARQTDHMLLWHVTHRGIYLIMGDDNRGVPLWSPVTNFSMRGSVFGRFESKYLPGYEWGTLDQTDISDNHYEDVAVSGTHTVNLGENYRTGPAGLDASGYPSASSPLLGKVDPLAVGFDAVNRVRSSPADIGAYERP